MAKKQRKPDSERIDTIDERLRRIEEFFRHFYPDTTQPGGEWTRWHDYLGQTYFPFGMMPAKDFVVIREIMRIRKEPHETPVDPWKHLVRRQHPWRKQLYVKGRNLTARQLVGGIKANRLDEKKAAANYDLPVETIREALAYVEQNKDLLETEAEIERLMLKRGEVARGPQTVSG